MGNIYLLVSQLQEIHRQFGSRLENCIKFRTLSFYTRGTSHDIDRNFEWLSVAYFFWLKYHSHVCAVSWIFLLSPVSICCLCPSSVSVSCFLYPVSVSRFCLPYVSQKLAASLWRKVGDQPRYFSRPLHMYIGILWDLTLVTFSLDIPQPDPNPNDDPLGYPPTWP